MTSELNRLRIRRQWPTKLLRQRSIKMRIINSLEVKLNQLKHQRCMTIMRSHKKKTSRLKCSTQTKTLRCSSSIGKVALARSQVVLKGIVNASALGCLVHMLVSVKAARTAIPPPIITTSRSHRRQTAQPREAETSHLMCFKPCI